MKNIAVTLMTVLLIGLFLSMGFTSAVSMNANAVAKAKASQKSVSLADAENEAELEDNFDTNEASEEIDDSVAEHAKESTFAQVSIGQGWATSSGNETTSEGNFVRIFWVEKTFVASENESTNETNQTNEATETFARGTLKVGSDLYKLVLDSQTNDSMVFDVNKETSDVNGTLVLEAETSLLGFTVWTGDLDLDSGKSYDLHVATKNSKVKGSVETSIDDDSGKQPGLKGNLNAAERGQGKKLGLLARIKAWFGGE